MCDLIYGILMEEKPFGQLKLNCMIAMLICSCGYRARTKPRKVLMYHSLVC